MLATYTRCVECVRSTHCMDCPSIYISVYLFINLSIYLHYLSAHLSICLSICLFTSIVSSPIYLPIYLAIYLHYLAFFLSTHTYILYLFNYLQNESRPHEGRPKIIVVCICLYYIYMYQYLLSFCFFSSLPLYVLCIDMSWVC